MNPRCEATIVIGEKEFRCVLEEDHTVENEPSRHSFYDRVENKGNGQKLTWLSMDWD
jgi:hypothetical protein